MAKLKGYTRSDGVKVKGHTRKQTRNRKRYSAAKRRAFDNSKTSKSGHKTWRERQKQKHGKAGLWSNVWAKRKREGKYKG